MCPMLIMRTTWRGSVKSCAIGKRVILKTCHPGWRTMSICYLVIGHNFPILPNASDRYFKSTLKLATFGPIWLDFWLLYWSQLPFTSSHFVTIATRISRYFVALPVDILLKKIIYLGGFQVSDKILFLVFFISAQMCLGCSTLFHTLNCHSKPVRAIFHRLDYAGIVILIVGSVIPWLYYGFYCQFYLKWIYISAVGVFGFITLILIMWEKFNKPAFRVYRAIVFVTLALVSALPILQFLYVNGYTESITKGSINKTLLMGALYISGAVLYAARIPERFMPGKCDIWFQSHQIFHVLVVAAAFVHYYAISDMAMYRFTQGPYCPDTIPEESWWGIKL